ncbi:TraB/GumN family protein [Niveibacterium sp. SC-1]|uniref:TraB/GumN family protein n=1 Tax=Niveibacterium sp. SC-1 TaxID=3135646 RepID=UPI00311FEFE2
MQGSRDSKTRWMLVLLACAAWAAPVRASPLLLWEVSGARAPIWLFGSVHLCQASCFPLPRAVESRFAKAQVLAVELDVSRPDMALTMASLSETASEPLSETLGREDWARLRRHVPASSFPDAALDRLSPTVAGVLVSVSAATRIGLSPSYGVDMHFIQRAQQEGKSLVELETVERQVEALNAGDPDESIGGLRALLRAADDGSLQRSLRETVAAWQAGDAGRIARVVQESEQMDASNARLYRDIFDRRNEEMSERIAELAREGKSVLVVVGSGHLAGRSAIPTLLARKGYRVRQLGTED